MFEALAFGKQGKKERSHEASNLARRWQNGAEAFVASYLPTLPAEGGR